MKTKTLSILTAALVAVGSFCLSGCETTKAFISGATTTLSAETSSNVVVNAEKTLKEAKLTIETFLKLEHNHRDFSRQSLPAIHSAAEEIRRRYPDALLAADRVKNKFKSNRTSSNEANLMTAVAVVVSISGEAKAYTKQLNEVKP